MADFQSLRERGKEGILNVDSLRGGDKGRGDVTGHTFGVHIVLIILRARVIRLDTGSPFSMSERGKREREVRLNHNIG